MVQEFMSIFLCLGFGLGGGLVFFYNIRSCFDICILLEQFTFFNFNDIVTQLHLGKYQLSVIKYPR